MRFNQFVYNEETRVHTLGKQIIPSVTQIISPLVDYSRVPPDALEKKRQLGLAFHKAIALYIRDNLNWDSLDERLIKPMEGFSMFCNTRIKGNYLWRQTGRQLAVEVPLCHPKLKYCGKPDLVTSKIIYEWKLRPYNLVADPLQMSGYQLLCGSEIEHLTVVCFDLDGDYKEYDVRNIQARAMFRKLLDRYKSEQKFNLLIKQWKEFVK